MRSDSLCGTIGGMSRCKGTTATGAQCTRGATQGDCCKTHAEPPKPKTKAPRARPPELDGIPDNELGYGMSCDLAAKLATRKGLAEYSEMADICLMSAANPLCKESVRVQWVREARECVRLAKEEERLSGDSGVSYTFVMRPPRSAVDDPTEDSEEPSGPA